MLFFSPNSRINATRNHDGGVPTVANMIKHRRQSIGMTIRELSERTGIAAGYLSDLENDDSDQFNPTKKVMDKIAEALSYSVPDLFYADAKRLTFGDQLRRSMREMRITSNELAQVVGVTPVYISYLINGKRRPSYQLMQRAAEALNDRRLIDAAGD